VTSLNFLGGYQNFSKGASLFFGNRGPHAKFHNPRTTPSGRIWVGDILLVLVVVVARDGSLTKIMNRNKKKIFEVNLN
jgi:hypothetical protein